MRSPLLGAAGKRRLPHSRVLVHRPGKMLLDGMGSAAEADVGELAFGGCLPVARKTQDIFWLLLCMCPPQVGMRLFQEGKTLSDVKVVCDLRIHSRL